MVKHKFRVGQKVRILFQNGIDGRDSDTYPDGPGYHSDMKNYEGKTYTVSEICIHKNLPNYRFNEINWLWSEIWLEPAEKKILRYKDLL